MKIFVAGLWHLGCVTAACLAKAGYDVTAYDPDQELIDRLQKNISPIYEPGLDEMLSHVSKSKKLIYSTNPSDANQAEIIWITFDTPLDDHDVADIDWVCSEIKKVLSYVQDNVLILISSQLPVGTTQQLWHYYRKLSPDKKISFAYVPENLRLGKAIAIFTQPDRIVVGLQNEEDKKKIKSLLQVYTDCFVWMSIESAEMTKHAINAFLANSIVFINELATLCEQVGADVREVESGLKSEGRIGPKAYLRAGHAIAGGTLARDVNYLNQIGKNYAISTPLFSSILTSNQLHKQWSCNKLIEILKNIQHKRIAILGLTYKAGTHTLRRSAAIEICQWLNEQGAKAVAYDPGLIELPAHLSSFIEFKSTSIEALNNADAVIISTEWPEFTLLDINEFVENLKQPLILDPGRFLAKQLSQDKRVRYFSVGSPA